MEVVRERMVVWDGLANMVPALYIPLVRLSDGTIVRQWGSLQHVGNGRCKMEMEGGTTWARQTLR